MVQLLIQTSKLYNETNANIEYIQFRHSALGWMSIEERLHQIIIVASLSRSYYYYYTIIFGSKSFGISHVGNGYFTSFMKQANERLMNESA